MIQRVKIRARAVGEDGNEVDVDMVFDVTEESTNEQGFSFLYGYAGEWEVQIPPRPTPKRRRATPKRSKA